MLKFEAICHLKFVFKMYKKKTKDSALAKKTVSPSLSIFNRVYIILLVFWLEHQLVRNWASENPANAYTDSDSSILISSLEVFERIDCKKNILPQYHLNVGVAVDNRLN